MNQHYQAATVCEVLGISQKLLSQWQDRGHVKPDVPAQGQGTRNLYTGAGICQAALFMRLSDAGFNRKDASRVAFDDRVKSILERKFPLTAGKNELARMMDPVQLLIAIRGHDDEMAITFADSGESLSKLFVTIATAKHSSIVNLDDVVLDVFDRLPRQ